MKRFAVFTALLFCAACNPNGGKVEVDDMAWVQEILKSYATVSGAKIEPSSGTGMTIASEDSSLGTSKLILTVSGKTLTSFDLTTYDLPIAAMGATVAFVNKLDGYGEWGGATDKNKKAEATIGEWNIVETKDKLRGTIRATRVTPAT